MDQKPERAEDGLFVLRGEVALDQQVNQIAVLPDFLPVDLEEAVLGPMTLVQRWGVSITAFWFMRVDFQKNYSNLLRI